VIKYSKHITKNLQSLELIITDMSKLHLQPANIRTVAALFVMLFAFIFLSACSENKSDKESKFMPVPDKMQAEKQQDEDLLNRRVESVLNEGITSQEGQQEAPRASKARPPNSGKEPMLMLDKTLKPFGDLVYHSDKLDYYECKGVVAPWFLELVVAEMNYFNELADLQFVDPKTCIVTFATEKSLTPGRLSIQLFENTREFDRCIRNEVCPVFRTVNFVPNQNAIHRSYFLSEIGRKLVQHHCVTDTGKWHKDQTCYTID
jgi:hypothetical protein